MASSKTTGLKRKQSKISLKEGDRGTLDNNLSAEQIREGHNCLFMPFDMVYDILEVINESQIKVRACGQIVSSVVPSNVFSKSTYREWDVKKDFPLKKKKARKQSGPSEEPNTPISTET